MSTRPDRFSPVARTLHWTMAALILAMLFIGVGMVSTAEPLYPTLLAWHRPIGALILVLALIRLGYRLHHPAPPLPADLPAVQKLAAHGSHWLLYATMIAMPLIGWSMQSAGGYPVRLTTWLVLPPIVPRDILLYGFLRSAHTVVAYCFFALILVHLAAALVHALIRRDGVFESMAGGR
ncbi:cytochrome b [Sphingomonas oligoaromativorans]|uniref:cytochrome b n=1 Tax=Sphingomonas oligoaromativorans TaxID=575322 RepID=UPI00141FB4DA|nr:cytochrome b [Sphingomonas oligoaromativorans]NIJ34043.1 cytochrome b561 [Sphingomonas oligoaromativorans]